MKLILLLPIQESLLRYALLEFSFILKFRILVLARKIFIYKLYVFSNNSKLFLGNIVTSSKTELRKSQSGKRMKRKPRVLFSQVSLILFDNY